MRTYYEQESLRPQRRESKSAPGSSYSTLDQPTMKIKKTASLIAIILSAGVTGGMCEGTAFSYQGRLTADTNFANGTFDLDELRFSAVGPGQDNRRLRIAIEQFRRVETRHVTRCDLWRSLGHFMRITCGRRKGEDGNVAVEGFCIR